MEIIDFVHYSDNFSLAECIRINASIRISCHIIYMVRNEFSIGT